MDTVVLFSKTIFMLRNLLLCITLLSSFMACREQMGPLGSERLPPRRIVLPDGWSISPIGQQLVLGDLPLQVVLSTDGRRAAVSNNGQSGHSLQWLDLEKDTVLHTLEVPKAWYGLALNAKGDVLYASGGNDNNVRQYEIVKDKLKLKDSIALGEAWPKAAVWTAGLCLDEASETLYALGKDSKTLYVLDLVKKQVRHQIELGAQPYTCLLSQDKKELYISLWGGKALTISVGCRPVGI